MYDDNSNNNNSVVLAIKDSPNKRWAKKNDIEIA
jgi:hypothetical protein